MQPNAPPCSKIIKQIQSLNTTRLLNVLDDYVYTTFTFSAAITFHIWTDVFFSFPFSLTQGLRAGSLHFPGTASTYDGEKALVSEVEPRFYDYSNETVWRQNIDKIMDVWFREKDLDFVALYFGEPDSIGHKYGPDSEQRREMVRQVDRTVGYLRSAVEHNGLTQCLNIIITADHGMTTVLRGGEVNEIVLFKIPGFSFQDLDFHLVDYGPSGLLLPKAGRLEKVYNALKGAHPHLHVYKKEEMPSRLHFAQNDRILPIILWADLGYVINGVSNLTI